MMNKPALQTRTAKEGSAGAPLPVRLARVGCEQVRNSEIGNNGPGKDGHSR